MSHKDKNRGISSHKQPQTAIKSHLPKASVRFRPPPLFIFNGLRAECSRSVANFAGLVAGLALGIFVGVVLGCAWVDASVRALPFVAIQVLGVAFVSGGVTGVLWFWGRNNGGASHEEH